MDNTAPVIAEVTAVTTPTNDNTPNYTFSSDEKGTITYGGSCSSSTTSAVSGNNAITFNTLSDGTYSDCTITVTDKAANESNLLTITTFEVDATASTLVETTSIASSTNDSTPDYTFVSSEAGTITYSGSCSSSTTSASAGTNTITFSSLSDGTYSDCKITITDSFGNSVTLSISSFVIDTTPPTVASVSPEDNSTDVAVSTTVAVTFSETMSTSTITTNTDNTTCYGSFQLSSDNFTTCIKMSAAPSASNSYKTYTVTPDDNLSRVTNYKIQITSSAADNLSHSLADNYTTSNGFTTHSAGTIRGTVKQSNGSALSGVLVSFSGINTDNATTDSSGNFNKTLGLGSYTLTYTKSGYISSTQSATLATDNQTVVVATLRLSSSSCSAGNISGTIKDAVSGSTISGVSISIRSGANVTSGSTISGKTDTTDSDGLYELTSVPAGVYTGEASKSGYITSYFNVNVCGNVSNQDSNMSTTLNSETMRIVTSWKGTDDLDSHLEIPVSDAQDGDSDKTDSTHL
ncbi:MAG: Ig-like domain-containing protein, partial [Anaerolineales bacterium]|nr:Ig-like domain-containing protein [Anaerolineales bacterium]